MAQLFFENNNLLNYRTRAYKELENAVRDRYRDKLEFSSLFVYPTIINNSNSMIPFDALCEQVSSELNYFTPENDPDDNQLTGFNSSDILLNYLLFENVSPLKVKNTLLNAFRNLSGDILNTRLNRYGLFLPRTGKVTCFTFIHSGGYYRFRLAGFKLKTVDENLQIYLKNLPFVCPNSYFLKGPRASGFNLKINVKLNKINSHNLIDYTGYALEDRKLKSAHEDVEKYFLDCDPETIAAEVPVWLEDDEIEQFLKFKPKGNLTGHIDILRYEKNGMIGIWDYKPRAKYEKKAHVQVYLYAVMLAKRTGIPLDNILCGYFDSEFAFYFYANEVLSGS